MSETLASKIAKASIEVGSLAADKRNKEQNYDYLSADQILQKQVTHFLRLALLSFHLLRLPKSKRLTEGKVSRHALTRKCAF